jgi:ABC-type lipoprotein export system ATPase subunit
VTQEPLIRLEDATKVYRMGDVEVHALRGVSLTIEQGDFTAIMGASGSGKSTLMNLLGCLDQPTSGRYLLEGQDVSRLSTEKLAEIRNHTIGFVFQSYHLIDNLTVFENLEIPPDLDGALKANPLADQYFQAFPRSVKRAILEWIANAKKPETRAKRTEETARLAAQNIRANQWRQ